MLFEVFLMNVGLYQYSNLQKIEIEKLFQELLTHIRAQFY